VLSSANQRFLTPKSNATAPPRIKGSGIKQASHLGRDRSSPALVIASALKERTSTFLIPTETFREGNEMQAAEFASCRHDSSLHHCFSGDKYHFRPGMRGEPEGVANGDVNAPGP
jgi:hypothetical protein